MSRYVFSVLFLLILVYGCKKDDSSQAPRRPLRFVSMHWVEVGNMSEVYAELATAQKAFVVFGATWCVPCHAVKDWWQKHGAPAGWKFIYIEAKDQADIDGEIGRTAFNLTRIFKVDGVFPVCAVVTDPRPGTRFESNVRAAVTHYHACIGEEIIPTLEKFDNTR